MMGLAALNKISKSVILAAVMLVYGLFAFTSINPPARFANAAVLQPKQGIRFSAPGIAYTKRAPDWLDETMNSSALDILLDLQSFAVEQTGPARILTISATTASRNITVAQDRTDLAVRLRRSDDTPNGLPPFVVKDVFGTLDRKTVHVSVKPGALSISVNGKSSLTAVLPDHALRSWAADYRLALGNEFTFDRPWLGVIHRATISVGARQIDYLKPGSLAIPETYYARAGPDRIHSIPFSRQYYSRGLFQDWTINFLGFIPLGFLLVVMFPAHATVWRIGLICFAVSLVIETTQIFLPWRYPALEDLILNSLGGFAGAAWGQFWVSRKRND